MKEIDPSHQLMFIVILRLNELVKEVGPSNQLMFIVILRLNELVKEVDPSEQLDEEVEEVLLQIADDFIEQTVTQGCIYSRAQGGPNISEL